MFSKGELLRDAFADLIAEELDDLRIGSLEDLTDGLVWIKDVALEG